MAEEADFSTWPTKHEARMPLGGVPERTFDRWLSDHNVKVAYRKVTGRRPVPVVDPGGMANRQRAMRKVAHQPAPVPASNGTTGLLASAFAIPSAWREMAATLLVNLSALAVKTEPPLPQPLFLTLEEASGYSGLPKDLLTRLIHQGKLQAWVSGGYRISRTALDDLVQLTPTGNGTTDRKERRRRA